MAIAALFSLTKEEEKHWKAVAKGNKAAGDRYLANLKVTKTIKAQKLILAELDKEFGKAGAAAGTGFQADINRANDAIEDAKITIAQGLMPALGQVARTLATTFRDPQVIKGLKDLGTGIGDVITGGLAFAKTVPWDKIASSLQTAAGFAKDLLNAFLGLPTWVQTAVVTGWGLNKITGGLITDLASGLIKGVLGMNAGVVNINAAVVNSAGLGAGAAGGIPGFSSTAQGTGGVSGLVKGIPIIGAAIAGAEFANIAADILAQKIKEVTPAVSSDIGSGATKVVVGALTGAVGIPNLISGLQDVAGNIANLIPLIGAKARAGTDTQASMEANRGNLADALTAANVSTSTDIESLRGTISADLQPLAMSSDIEVLRGQVADGLSTVDTSTLTAGQATASAAQGAGIMASNAAYGGASIVAGAIAANRPTTIVTVNISATTVQKTVDVQTRYGPSGSDRNQGPSHGPGQGD